MTAPDNCSGGFSVQDVNKDWVVKTPSSGSVEAQVQSCQEARTYTIVLIARSPSGNLVARDQVVLHIKGGVKERINVAGGGYPHSWDVWMYFYNDISDQSVSYGPESLVPTDPAKRFVDIPFLAWWTCTQESDCQEMAKYYAPTASDESEQNPPMFDPVVSNAGGGCNGCDCAWITGSHFYNGHIEIHVRDAQWNLLGQIGHFNLNEEQSAVSFIVPEEMRSHFASQGLRFTIVNKALLTWTTSEVVVCSEP